MNLSLYMAMAASPNLFMNEVRKLFPNYYFFHLVFFSWKNNWKAFLKNEIKIWKCLWIRTYRSVKGSWGSDFLKEMFLLKKCIGLCEYMCTACVQCPQSLEEVGDPLGLELRWSWTATCVGPLQEQWLLFTTRSSLQPWEPRLWAHGPEVLCIESVCSC